MKIACFSESPADQAALSIFAEGIFGETLEDFDDMDLQAHGHGGVFAALDGVIPGLHYGTDAMGLVVVVDSDHSALHDQAHDAPTGARDDCRFCRLRQIATKACGKLKPRHGRQILKVAVGLAVPAIEAWYLVGKNHQVGEAAWKVNPPFTTTKLKQEVYGTEHETERSTPRHRQHESHRRHISHRLRPHGPGNPILEGSESMNPLCGSTDCFLP